MAKKTIIIKGYTLQVLRESTMAGGVKKYEYERATRINLSEAYKKPSDDKQRAYNRCMRMLKEMGGKNHKIPSSNGWAFTFAFELPDGSVVYVTKDNTYIIR